MRLRDDDVLNGPDRFEAEGLAVAGEFGEYFPELAKLIPSFIW